MKLLHFHLLGSGASMGVPVIGCSCSVCSSLDARNQRLRTSALLETDEGSFLIDPGPDFRLQALRVGLENRGGRSLKGVLVTHTHSDHIAGIDDLRICNFTQKRPVPMLLSDCSHKSLLRRYDYLIQSYSNERQVTMPVSLQFQVLPASHGTAQFEGLDLSYCTYWQGSMPVLGFRMDKLAYVTDIKEFDQQLLDLISGVKWLIISAGCLTRSHMHLQIEEAIELARASGAQHTVFIHLDHKFDFLDWQNRLPKGMSLGYDGLSLDLRSDF